MLYMKAETTNHYKYIYQTVFSTRFGEQGEDDHVLDEIELYITLKNI